MIDIDYESLPEEIASGAFRVRLEAELSAGFEEILARGERLPTASHYASQIARVIDAGGPVDPSLSFDLYQEIVSACENARVNVGEEPRIEV